MSTELAPCPHCGVRDALGRHDPLCGHAIDLGLPRLAEGEEPIEPEDDLPLTVDGPPPQDPDTEEMPAALLPVPPPLFARTEQSGLYFAYPSGGVNEFDALIFANEITALRYAVEHGWKVKPLTIARSLREQVAD